MYELWFQVIIIERREMRIKDIPILETYIVLPLETFIKLTELSLIMTRKYKMIKKKFEFRMTPGAWIWWSIMNEESWYFDYKIAIILVSALGKEEAMSFDNNVYVNEFECQRFPKFSKTLNSFYL